MPSPPMPRGSVVVVSTASLACRVRPTDPVLQVAYARVSRSLAVVVIAGSSAMVPVSVAGAVGIFEWLVIGVVVPMARRVVIAVIVVRHYYYTSFYAAKSMVESGSRIDEKEKGE